MVRIATFNVNGVNGRLPVVLKWLAETRYDVVCLQELKTSEVVNRRAGETVVRPMMSSINQWRQNSVHLSALLERARTKGEPMDQSLQALDTLRHESLTVLLSGERRFRDTIRPAGSRTSKEQRNPSWIWSTA